MPFVANRTNSIIGRDQGKTKMQDPLFKKHRSFKTMTSEPRTKSLPSEGPRQPSLSVAES